MRPPASLGIELMINIEDFKKLIVIILLLHNLRLMPSIIVRWATGFATVYCFSKLMANGNKVYSDSLPRVTIN